MEIKIESENSTLIFYFYDTTKTRNKVRQKRVEKELRREGKEVKLNQTLAAFQPFSSLSSLRFIRAFFSTILDGALPPHNSNNIMVMIPN